MFATFDKEGKYLYLTASTDAALSTGWLDMSSLAHPVTRSVYAIVLKKGVAISTGPGKRRRKGQRPDKPPATNQDKDKPSRDRKGREGQRQPSPHRRNRLRKHQPTHRGPPHPRS